MRLEDQYRSSVMRSPHSRVLYENWRALRRPNALPRLDQLSNRIDQNVRAGVFVLSAAPTTGFDILASGPRLSDLFGSLTESGGFLDLPPRDRDFRDRQRILSTLVLQEAPLLAHSVVHWKTNGTGGAPGPMAFEEVYLPVTASFARVTHIVGFLTHLDHDGRGETIPVSDGLESWELCSFSFMSCVI